MNILKRDIIDKLNAIAASETDLDVVKTLKMASKLIDKPYNLLLLADGYKYSHHKFYLPKTSKIGFYIESRGGLFKETEFVGLQVIIKRFLSGVTITKEEIDEAEQYLQSRLGVFETDDVFDRSKFDYIVEHHGGKLPIEIKAVPEGSVVPTGNVLAYIENTDENCSWLVGFLEDILLHVWYPITVATLSREVKKVAKSYFERYTDHDKDTIDFLLSFVLNDFGMRGVSSMMSSSDGGMAHLTNFDGSDNTIASYLIVDYYNGKRAYGKTIPATEHSIMCMKGKEGERDMIERVLDAYPNQIVACVMDTYDIKNSISNIVGKDLKTKILSRPNIPGKQIVFRPDSGHVVNTLKVIFRELFNTFGYTTNSKGMKVLPPQIRVIQGDGVNYESIIEVYQAMVEEGVSPENFVFGMGGKLLQSGIDRDTQKFAMKACFAIIDGVEVDVVKSPTEIDENFNSVPSFKKSKRGTPKLVLSDGKYVTYVPSDPQYKSVKDELVTVFRNGDLLVDYTFDEIRERAKL